MVCKENKLRDRITLISTVLNKYIYNILLRETNCDSYMLIILYIDKKYLKNVISYLRYDGDLLFNTLLDVWGVDYLSHSKRFEVNYLLISIKYQLRLLLKVKLSEDEYIDSLVSYFKSANWLEREVWDMYGVYFYQHKDLRRILTDYGFQGHPLRKDFPLVGYTEVRYDDGEKRVLSEPVELAQEYRFFNFLNPWEKNQIVG